jgi:hypothetical protein
MPGIAVAATAVVDTKKKDEYLLDNILVNGTGITLQNCSITAAGDVNLHGDNSIISHSTFTSNGEGIAMKVYNEPRNRT